MFSVVIEQTKAYKYRVVYDYLALGDTVEESVLSALTRLYGKQSEGEGWYGKDEANQVIDDYFERRFM